MEIFWKLFYATGDPLTYMLYRDEQSQTEVKQSAESTEESKQEKEAKPWLPPPIS